MRLPWLVIPVLVLVVFARPTADAGAASLKPFEYQVAPGPVQVIKESETASVRKYRLCWESGFVGPYPNDNLVRAWAIRGSPTSVPALMPRLQQAPHASSIPL